ncbi:MAG TPA: hypothetical protein VNM66_01135 [Thermodesulfobacteriota bacterium]|nr:hypothetical protein [Thermodesulfobacteriota bacterium]
MKRLLTSSGLAVAAGLVLLVPAAVRADHTRSHGVEGVRSSVERDVDTLRSTDPEDRAGVATEIHQGVLGTVQTVVPEDAAGAVGEAKETSASPLERGGRGASRPAAMPSGFGRGGLGGGRR